MAFFLDPIGAEVTRPVHGAIGFVELQNVPSEKSSKSANILKPQLKLIGVDKKTIDSFAPLLAKRRRSVQDKKASDEKLHQIFTRLDCMETEVIIIRYK